MWSGSDCSCSSTGAERLDQPGRPSGHQQQEQSHRKANAYGQRAYHLFGITLVVHQVKQGRAETRHDADQNEADQKPEKFHNRYYRHVKLEIVVGRRVFSPSWLMTVATLCLLVLFVIWLRTMKGHFTPQRHFAFEAVAWYWHFVDVVWLGLFVFVYWV